MGQQVAGLHLLASRRAAALFNSFTLLCGASTHIPVMQPK